MMRMIKRYMVLMAVTAALFSCLDETLVGTTYEAYPPEEEVGERDMHMKISVPRVYSVAGDIDREERIDTLDVLVFKPWPGNPGKKVLLAALTGRVVKDDMGKVRQNVFKVGMPLGEDLDVHVFANSHGDLLRCGAFKARGREMQTVLGSLIHAGKYEMQKPETLFPMHGCVEGITIKSDSKDELPVSVLRSVAKVSVMINGTLTSDGKLAGGELDEFKLYEMYAFFPADSARIATADTTKFYTAGPDAGNVKTATLPAALRAGNRPDSLSILKTAAVKQIESIYLYENIPWSPDGFDFETSRLVLGGVFTDRDGKQDKTPDGTPRISYYRVNFWDENEVQYPVLRNHHYVFSIKSVAAPGYDTPRDAAEGKPINIMVTIIDWMNDLNDVIYDGQNYFDLSDKNVTLPRNANSVRTLQVESDVDVKDWKMYFKDVKNGVTTPQTWFTDKQGKDSIGGTTGTTLSNSRYKVTKERNKILVQVLKKYSDLPVGESRSDILVIAAKNLRVYIYINQVDKSPDDWGNGGEDGSDVGTKGEDGVIDKVEVPDWTPGNGGGTPDMETGLD